MLDRESFKINLELHVGAATQQLGVRSTDMRYTPSDNIVDLEATELDLLEPSLLDHLSEPTGGNLCILFAVVSVSTHGCFVGFVLTSWHP